MKNRIKSRDWETLSAYLDDQLSSRERARLESRLQNDADLQDALEQLRQTRGVLRSLPKLRVPRNFTLTPQMVGQDRQTPDYFPVLRLASVLAMVLLAVVIIGDFMLPTAPSMAPADEAQIVALAPTQLVEKAAEIREEAEPYPGAQVFAEPAFESAAEEAPAELLPELATQVMQPGGEGAVLELESDSADEPRAPIMKAPAPTPTALATLAVAGSPYPTPVKVAGEAESATASDSASNTLLRVLEIGLVIIALSTGIAAFILRRGSVG